MGDESTRFSQSTDYIARNILFQTSAAMRASGQLKYPLKLQESELRQMDKKALEGLAGSTTSEPSLNKTIMSKISREEIEKNLDPETRALLKDFRSMKRKFKK